jgi:hypothetical protein
MTLSDASCDTSDDVHRATVTSLAFLLFKNPGQVPQIVQLLSKSYNPHIRCSAILALSIACAGTSLQDADEILEPMTKDSVDFVCQGVFIALGIILVQQSEASSLSPPLAHYTPKSSPTNMRIPWIVLVLLSAKDSLMLVVGTSPSVCKASPCLTRSLPPRNYKSPPQT